MPSTQSPEQANQTPSWAQIHVTVEQSQIEGVEQLLLSEGALAVTLSETSESDELWEPEPGSNPLWQVTRVTGLFEQSQHPDQNSVLTHQLAQLPVMNIQWEQFSNKVWEREWLKYFQPVLIADRLWIAPNTPEDPELTPTKLTKRPEHVILNLDPGLAFGTGSHPTTRLCLKWLCQIDLTGKTVIDYGCGSGILGIAALLLGAKKVIAIDNDPQALKATEQNALKNQVQDKLIVGLPHTLQSQQACCDVLIANILAQPLMQLCQRFSQLLVSQSGLWAISGLLINQIPLLEEVYTKYFVLENQQTQEDWALLHGQSLRVERL